MDVEKTYVGLQLHSAGDPTETVSLVQLNLPDLEKDEVLAELVAAPLNPYDLGSFKETLKIEGLNFPTPKFPIFIGSEGIAKIIEIGDDVENIQVGDIVSIQRRTKAWSERMVLSSKGRYPLPKTNLLQMSFFNLNPIMAYVMLTEIIPLKQGDWMIQSGANSSIGQYVIQLAKKLGIRTINIVRRESSVKELKELGADYVFMNSTTIIDDINQIKEIGDIRLALDTVGAEMTNKLGALLAHKGTLVSYGTAGGDFNLKINQVLFFFKRITLECFLIDNWYQDTSDEKIQKIESEMIDLIARNEIKTKIDATFSLRDYKSAFSHALSTDRDGKDGKVVFIGPSYSQIH